jgi:nucleotide-binding universal stress UspA family protein
MSSESTKEITMNAIRKIIVPTDFSEASDVAARSAAILAKPDGASVHLLHVIRLPFLHTTYDVNVPEAIWEGLRKGTRERLSETSRALEAMGVSEVEEIVSESRQPSEAVAENVKKLDADLVVMGTHGRQGLSHTLLGSVAERTIRASPVPVLTVKGAGLTGPPVRRVLLATDFSSHAKEAQSLAAAFARRTGAQLDIVHVLDESPEYIRTLSAEVAAFEDQARAMAGDHLEELAGRLRADDLAVITHLRKGRPVDAVVEEADRLESDLIVLGTHGHTGFARVALGSVAERTLRHAKCSVLTTRSAAD